MEIKVDTFYSDRVYYPFLPLHVFDALEAAYLSGKESIVISEADYNAILSSARAAGVCHA